MNPEIQQFRTGILADMDRKLAKAPDYDLDPWLIDFAKDISGLPVNEWWNPLFSNLRDLPTEFREKGRQIGRKTIDILREKGLTPEHAFLVAAQAVTNEFQVPGPFEGLSEHTVQRIPLEDILNKHPGILEQGLELPPPGVSIKGGGARTLLKLAAGSPENLIQTELPLTDIDYIVTDLDALPQLARTNNLIDLEVKFGKKPEELITQADVNMNAAVITDTELVFSDAAYEAAQNGLIKTNYHARRGFYGDDFKVEKKVVIPSSMQTFRLMKLVAEGRANALEYPVSGTKGLENNWLGIYRRYRRRSDFLPIAQNYFLLAQQMGIPTFGNDFMDTVTTLHEQYSYYPMTSTGPLDQAFYILSKVIPHVQDWYRITKDYKPKEVQLPETNIISLPEKTEIDLEGLHEKHMQFEEKLAQRSS